MNNEAKRVNFIANHCKWRFQAKRISARRSNR